MRKNQTRFIYTIAGVFFTFLCMSSLVSGWIPPWDPPLPPEGKTYVLLVASCDATPDGDPDGDFFFYTNRLYDRLKDPALDFGIDHSDPDSILFLSQYAYEEQTQQWYFPSNIVDDKATIPNFISTLNHLKNKLSQYDTLMLFLTGHGGPQNGGSIAFGHGDPDLCPGMTYADIDIELDKFGCENMLISIDACESGCAIDNVGTSVKGYNRFVVTSNDVDNNGYYMNTVNYMWHGLTMISGERQMDINGNGEILYSEMKSYLLSKKHDHHSNPVCYDPQFAGKTYQTWFPFDYFILASY